MTDIEHAIRASERTHAAELRVAIEAALGIEDLIAGLSARDRALQVFEELRVWDTEQDNGVLIYVLHAERALEIIADRGYNPRVDAATWQALCAEATHAFTQGQYPAALVHLVERVGALAARHYPPRGDDMNELPDAALFL